MSSRNWFATSTWSPEGEPRAEPRSRQRSATAAPPTSGAGPRPPSATPPPTSRPRTSSSRIDPKPRPKTAPAQQTPREGPLMGMLGWVMMGLAIWHLHDLHARPLLGRDRRGIHRLADRLDPRRPDHFSIKFSELRIPGEKATTSRSCSTPSPARYIGIAIVYLEGMRRERAHAAAQLAEQPTASLSAGRALCLARPVVCGRAAATDSTSRTARRSRCRACSASSVPASRSPRCSCAAGSSEPGSARELPRGRRRASRRAPSPGIEQAVADDPRPRGRAAAGSPSTATTTWTGLLDGHPGARAAPAGRGRRLLPPRPGRRRLRALRRDRGAARRARHARCW